MASDDELLRCYVRDRSEEAFAELVRRHLRLVYFTAWRRANGFVVIGDEALNQLRRVLSPLQVALLQLQQLARRTQQQIAAHSGK